MPLARPVRAPVTAAALAALALATAGCSNTQSPADKAPHTGSATASTVDGVQQVTVHATDFRFTPSTITVHPGKVRIILINDGSGAPHNLQVSKYTDKDYVPDAQAGQTTERTFTAPAPGRYQFVCSFHIKQGMTGTLVVLPN
jgi:plastocyanin